MARIGISVPKGHALGKGEEPSLTNAAEDTFTHLPPGVARLGAVVARPRFAAAICVVVLAALGWLYLGIIAGSSIARGGDLLGLVRALCSPLGSTGFGMPTESMTESTRFALLFAMWAAMSLAMMLPSAGPMILTYAEIADTAARKHEPIVTPFVLTAGYIAIWIAFALVAAALQMMLMRWSLLDAAMAPASRTLSAAAFVLAGAYQFSSLKQSCLRACQRPFPFFFSNWKTTARGIFWLGLRQGLHCFGCCWAMMLLMFAVGAMNILWMAALAIVMTLEKLSATPRVSHVLGVVLLAIGLALYGVEIVTLMRS
jgi:predicted metal-binding membrane protein